MMIATDLCQPVKIASRPFVTGLITGLDYREAFGRGDQIYIYQNRPTLVARICDDFQDTGANGNLLYLGGAASRRVVLGQEEVGNFEQYVRLRDELPDQSEAHSKTSLLNKLVWLLR